MTTHSRRRGALAVCLGLAWVVSATWGMRAQQPGADYTFTGKSWRTDTKALGLTGRGFEAGARSDWHTHAADQLLFVQQGGMRYQVRGQKMTEVALHGTAYLPGGVPHWHGATSKVALEQVSVTFAPGIKWMEKVTDEEYAGRK